MTLITETLPTALAGVVGEQRAGEVVGVLFDLVRRTGLAGLIATHNLELARRMDRVLALEDGKVRVLDK